MTNEERIAQLIEDEVTISKSNQNMDNMDFESIIDMMEMKRTEKEYDWLSDVFLPELPSIILTDASQWANQYFQSRDFVDVYLEGDQPTDKASCRAIKKLINKTLNNRRLNYYQKYMRARLINAMAGSVYLMCWWDFESEQVLEGYEDRELDIDVYGNKITDRLVQTPQVEKVAKYTQRPIIDHFNFDVLDPRNVFTDNKYVYSVQEKDWVTIRSEVSYDQLKKMEKQNGYFNLDKLLEIGTQEETDVSKETYNKDDKQQKVIQTSVQYYDRYLRFGKMWAIVKQRNQSNYPIKIAIGIDDDGRPLKGAELIETISESVVSGNSKMLIRFQATPFIDAQNKPFKPLVRGLCYIHPTKDTGMASGKYLRESQIAINDTFNMSQDRVKLATLPVMKGRRYALEDNSTVYIEPEHVIMLDDPKGDLEELVIKDDVNGALNQIGMLKNGMQQVESIYPTTMGDLPGKASTTATAVAGAETRTNARGNYKSLTVEYTMLSELYDMIIMMSYRFMRAETALKVMGEDALSFNADGDYVYKPVSSNIEMEHNKYKKIQNYDQMLGRLANLIKGIPQMMPILARIVQRQMELLGDEYQDIADMITKLSGAKYNEEAPQPPQAGQPQGEAMSNQQGVPQMAQEQMARSNMSTGSPEGGM